jgi:hypothetical protein
MTRLQQRPINPKNDLKAEVDFKELRSNDGVGAARISGGQGR